MFKGPATSPVITCATHGKAQPPLLKPTLFHSPPAPIRASPPTIHCCHHLEHRSLSALLSSQPAQTAEPSRR
ncbi:hypothetical protein M0R45_026255 [Rubus argutus]|uniref:Uncharacterized protein n=1 Tax=Rubus argutus TaxID=59490 RepID=A0AAW1X0D7_RUBAR